MFVGPPLFFFYPPPPPPPARFSNAQGEYVREKGIDFCKVELTTLQGHMVSSSDDSTYASFTLQGYA